MIGKLFLEILPVFIAGHQIKMTKSKHLNTVFVKASKINFCEFKDKLVLCFIYIYIHTKDKTQEWFLWELCVDMLTGNLNPNRESNLDKL